MIKIVKVHNGPENRDYSVVDFVDIEQNIYSLDRNIFFDTSIRNNQLTYRLKEAYKDIFEYVFKKNPPDQSYRIEIDGGTNATANTQRIKRIIDMPHLTQNLANFYNSFATIDNFALAIQKYGRFVDKKLEYMNANGDGLFHQYFPARQYTTAIMEKQKSIVDQLTSQAMKVVTLSMKQDWRLAIGLGNASAYNNGFTFHPIFGIPYIPGQNVKGILRNYIIKEYFCKNIEEAVKDPVFCHFFGCPDKSYDKTARAGKLIFMDAFPVNSDGSFEILPDIMNPHYKPYYEDEHENPQMAPHDAYAPVPIIFLTIKNAEFQFNFYLKRSEDISPNKFLAELSVQHPRKDGEQIMEADQGDCEGSIKLFDGEEPISSIIRKTLIEALEIKGVGAKTRVGYGRFTEIPNTQNS